MITTLLRQVDYPAKDKQAAGTAVLTGRLSAPCAVTDTGTVGTVRPRVGLSHRRWSQSIMPTRVHTVCMHTFICMILWCITRAASEALASGLIAQHQFPLSTQNRNVVDVFGKPVKLHCANWYGAHMEEFVVDGLHVQNLSNLSSTIVNMGFNCIRLPFSLDLWFKNPLVDNRFVAANLQLQGLRTMEIFDKTIESLSNHSVITILNNHNSEAGWCCKLNSQEGIWSTDEYSATDWANALGGMALRYKDDPYVAGFDLRNEIHDVKHLNRFVTWGASDDIERDWKAATEFASKKLFTNNPDMLVIVSGLCFTFDLRKLAVDPPDLKQKHKLVWTTHYYSFSRWWQHVEGVVGLTFTQIALLSVSLLVACLCICVALVRNEAKLSLRERLLKHLILADWAITVGCWLLIVATPTLHYFGVGVRMGYDAGGCATMGEETAVLLDRVVTGTIALGSTSVCCSIVLYCLRRRKLFPSTSTNTTDAWPRRSWSSSEYQTVDNTNEGTSVRSSPDIDIENSSGLSSASLEQRSCAPCLLLNALILLVVVICVSSFMLSFSVKADTYAMLHDELYHKWMLGGQAGAPVWVGEFGTSNGDSIWWKQMMTFLKQYNLGFAYWPLNAQKWNNGSQSYSNEGYGLLAQTWASVAPGRRIQLIDLQALGEEDPGGVA